MVAVTQISAYDEFVDFITSSPSLEEIVHFTVSPTAQGRISELLEANRARRLSDSEEAELNEYIRLEHIVRKAKLRAMEKLAD